MRKHFQDNMQESLEDSIDFPEGAGGSQLDDGSSRKYDEGSKYEGSKYEGKYYSGSIQAEQQRNGQKLLVINTEKL